MNRLERFAPQRGFTLVELVIIIVVLGILASVAIPYFADTSGEAKMAKASAIFGSLKASYAVQSAIHKGVVSVTNIITDHDPSCTVSSMTVTCGNAIVVLRGADANHVTAPGTTGSLWTCTVSDVSGTPACP